MAKGTNNKLELVWAGKEGRANPEPRILVEDKTKSVNSQEANGNMLIHGDNLLALKSLENEFAGKIKCIYIDPPYNTGNAFTNYDDGFEHSIWLSLMRDRLELLRTLLSNDGSIWITLDDNEVHYAKILCDEVFGRTNFLGNIIWQHSVQGKNDSKNFSLHHNHNLVYRKTEEFTINRIPREEKHNKAYSNPDNDPRGPWRSGDVRSPNLRENLIFDITTPSGKIIKAPEKGWRWSKDKILEKISSKEIVFSQDEKRIIRKIYLSEQNNRVPETIWFGEEVGTSREANSENKELFPENPFSTPKPERLIERVLTLGSKEGDLVLDSFLGSGTTAAVAHKMGRQWIGIELGEHAYTHCLPRLQKVVDGSDQGGISKAVNWKGGGGFKFYELASSLIVKDSHGKDIISKEYNGDMLAEAMCKLMGYKYSPDKEIFWKQGCGTEKNYIFTTTMVMTAQYLEEIQEQLGKDSLLICCSAFIGNPGCYKNITIKKIPQAVLDKCEWNKPGYPLPVKEDFTPADFEFDEEE